MADPPSTPGARRRLAIVHYHFKPGGVTTVVEHTLAGLMVFADAEVVILTGEPYSGKGLTNVYHVPGLSYDSLDEQRSTPEELAEALHEFARAGLDGELPEIWHCHNHALGKNSALPGALGLLAQAGQRLFLHVHDFAEDGRPENFKVLRGSGPAYPVLPSVHYGTINSRDRGLLIDAGVPKSRVHDLANPVVAHSEDRHATGKRPIVLYPTRGIRRKNIGEAVLLAALCRDRAFVATTRVPDNPQWQGVHDEWVSYAAENALPIGFGVVGKQSPERLKLSSETGRSLKAWLSAAACVLTTSVAEGFGLAYVESLLDGLPLLGRDLPEITRDFVDQGLAFPGLYQALRVPISWIDEDALSDLVEEQLTTVFEAYEKSLPPGAVSRALYAMVDRHQRVDFGRLTEPFQRVVIDRIIADPSAAKKIIVETPGALVNVIFWLDSWFEEGLEIPKLNEQRRLLRKMSSPRAYTERLTSAYDVLENEPVADSDASLESDVGVGILEAFLSPERFHLLRS
ncbi:MAG: hypothetical protein GWQ08_01435 [Verrucomicrobiaceae bacterium]|nr:hypothetical protein [Verrucomicrobiaceae bacterium]